MSTATPKVTLLNWTPLPKETVYSVWEASKAEGLLRTPQQIREDVPPEEVDKLFRAVIAQRIPIGEHIDFVFILENVSVSWREQAVRHRIGTLASPERVSLDHVMLNVIPDLANSSWWSQSMRIQNMGRFATDGKYRTPETLDGKMVKADSVLEHDMDAEAFYHGAMAFIEDAYNKLVKAGVPMEDARELIPLGAQHRISWKVNMSSLQHIVGKRGCWILQLGLWGPVIQGMVNELAEKVDPIFRETVAPPCVKGDEFTGCVYHEECRRRYTGDDELPPCPLHLAQHVVKDPDKVRLRVAREDFTISHPDTGEAISLPLRREMLARAEDYTRFWGRDPYTGERLPAR